MIQFAYTCIQDHAVWGTLSFWEQSFYQDVQKQIRQLYLPQYEEHLVTEKSKEGSRSPMTPREVSATGDRLMGKPAERGREVWGGGGREVGGGSRSEFDTPCAVQWNTLATKLFTGSVMVSAS